MKFSIGKKNAKITQNSTLSLIPIKTVFFQIKYFILLTNLSRPTIKQEYRRDIV